MFRTFPKRVIRECGLLALAAGLIGNTFYQNAFEKVPARVIKFTITETESGTAQPVYVVDITYAYQVDGQSFTGRGVQRVMSREAAEFAAQLQPYPFDGVYYSPWFPQQSRLPSYTGLNDAIGRLVQCVAGIALLISTISYIVLR